MRKIFILLLLLFLVSCNFIKIEKKQEKSIKNNKIKQEKIVKKKIDLGFFYKKDNKHLYFRDKIIPLNWIDLKTFIILNNYFAKDKNNVYQIVDPCDFWKNYWEFRVLKWADSKTFKTWFWIFWKDDKKVYNYYVDFIDNPDPKSFQHIKWFYNGKNYINWIYKDKNYYYHYYRDKYSYTNECIRWKDYEKLYRVKNVDYKTYKYYNFWFYKDKNYYFFNWKKIEWTDSSKKLLDLWNNFYFNNWNILFIYLNKVIIVKKNFKEKNLKNIIITDEYICWPLKFDDYKKMIFFWKNELPKNKCNK